MCNRCVCYIDVPCTKAIVNLVWPLSTVRCRRRLIPTFLFLAELLYLSWCVRDLEWRKPRRPRHWQPHLPLCPTLLWCLSSGKPRHAEAERARQWQNQIAIRSKWCLPPLSQRLCTIRSSSLSGCVGGLYTNESGKALSEESSRFPGNWFMWRPPR